MNSIFAKSLRNEQRQSASSSSDLSKNTESSKHTFTQSELTEKLRKLSNSFDEKINNSRQSENKEHFEASILQEASNNRLAFGKKELISYEKTHRRSNFLELLSQNDFGLYFSQKESTGSIVDKAGAHEELLWNSASKLRKDIGSEGDQSILIGSFNLKQNCLLSAESFDAPVNDFLSFFNKKEARNETSIDSYEDIPLMPLFISKKNCFEMKDSGNEELLSIKKARNKGEPCCDDRLLLKPEAFQLKLNRGRVYPCEICSAEFRCPQGLGGHMSRTHKDQSLKFKHKREIREKRASIRNQREEAKRILCEYHNENYEQLILTKEGKDAIKTLITQHMKQFKSIRDLLPMQI